MSGKEITKMRIQIMIKINGMGKMSEGKLAEWIGGRDLEICKWEGCAKGSAKLWRWQENLIIFCGRRVREN